MSETVADFLVSRLHEWGVRRIYGYPGDGINGIMGALQRAQEQIEFIQVRHEDRLTPTLADIVERHALSDW